MAPALLNYSDGKPIDVFDQVALRHEGHEFVAVVTTLLPMSGMVRVMYRDTVNTLRNGDPRRCYKRAEPGQLDLIRRDG